MNRDVDSKHSIKTRLIAGGRDVARTAHARASTASCLVLVTLLLPCAIFLSCASPKQHASQQASQQRLLRSRQNMAVLLDAVEATGACRSQVTSSGVTGGCPPSASSGLRKRHADDVDSQKRRGGGEVLTLP